MQQYSRMLFSLPYSTYISTEQQLWTTGYSTLLLKKLQISFPASCCLQRQSESVLCWPVHHFTHSISPHHKNNCLAYLLPSAFRHLCPVGHTIQLWCWRLEPDPAERQCGNVTHHGNLSVRLLYSWAISNTSNPKYVMLPISQHCRVTAPWLWQWHHQK